MPRELRNRVGNAAGRALTFRAFTGDNGVSKLDPLLTINGSTSQPCLRLTGGDASSTGWQPWSYGTSFSLVSAGNAPLYNRGSPLLGAIDDSVYITGKDYYKTSASTSCCNIGADDFVAEFVFNMPPADVLSAARIFFSKRDGSNAGFRFRFTTTKTVELRVEDTSGTGAADVSAAITPDCWYHAMVFVNRSEASANGVNFYINGVKSGAGADFSSVNKSLENPAPVAVGAFNDGSNPLFGNLAYIATWNRADWHQEGAAGPTEWATIAAERFAKLTGIYPAKAKGTAMPTTATRASDAWLPKVESTGETRLYHVGEEWMRLAQRIDGNGETVTGYLSEPQDDNEMFRSEQLDRATWVKTSCTVSTNSTAVAAPDGRYNADGIVATNASTSHLVHTSTASGLGEHVFAAFLHAGDQDWAKLQSPVTGNAYAYYYLGSSSVSVGTTGAAADAFVEDHGNGWARCILVYNGDAPAHAHQIFSCPADATDDFLGDGSTVNTYVWGGSHSNVGLHYPTLYIGPTSTATVTRVKDQLQYVAGDNIGGEDNGKGTLSLNWWHAAIDTSTDATLFSINDGGAAGDRVDGIVLTSGDVALLETRAAGGDNGDAYGTADITNDAKHALSFAWETNRVRVKTDGVIGTADTSATMPDDLDRLDVGHNGSQTEQPDGMIGDLRIYSIPTDKV